MTEPKSNYAVTGYCKRGTGASQVVSVGVVNLSDIVYWVNRWMDKLYVIEEGDTVRIVEVRVTKI